MTVEQLRAECARARSQGLEHLTLVVPRKREPRGSSPRVRVMPGVTGVLVGSRIGQDLLGVDLIVSVALADVERALERTAK